MNHPIHSEFQTLIEQLRSELKTAPALEYSAQLQPLQAEDLYTEISYIKELDEIIRFEGGLRFFPLQDIRPALTMAGLKDNFLAGEEILEICICLELHGVNQARLAETASRFPKVYTWVQKLPSLEQLRFSLSSRLDDEGNLLDDASPELRSIRRRKSTIRSDIQDRLQRLMETEDYKQSMQDRLITLRDGRFVLPLKSSGRSRIDGIVHSFSNSGETAFVEPALIVSLNNEMVEIDEKEAAEMRRILRSMTGEIAEHISVIREIYETVGQLEWLYVRALFGTRCQGVFPHICADEYLLDIRSARHPLLRVSEPVPIDIQAGTDSQGLIISGPNAGGKTVALKTAGILSLMLRYAIPLPVHPDSRLSLFDTVYAEIGDEQSLDNNLSSFSGHIRQLSEILQACTCRDLVLIDEITAATDPREGEVLGREIILYLLEKKPVFIVTTHYPGIKELAYSHPGLENAFVEFDEKRLVPLYRLCKGGTGSSFALDIARRYGIPETVIRQARQYMDSHISNTEKLVKTLEQERNQVAGFKEKAAAELREARQLKRQAAQQQQSLLAREEELQRKGLQALQNELDETLREVSELRKKLRAEGKSHLHQADKLTERTRQYIQEEKQRQQDKNALPAENLQPGETVYVNSLEKQGIIEIVKGDQVKVRVGIISTFVHVNELFAVAAESPAAQNQTRGRHELNRQFAYILDLRGERMEDALKLLEKDLETANMQGANRMEVIHGKGEGILRKAIWEFLKKHPAVRSYYHAKPEEGGQGKTVIELKA